MEDNQTTEPQQTNQETETTPDQPSSPAPEDEIRILRSRVSDMGKQLAALKEKSKAPEPASKPPSEDGGRDYALIELGTKLTSLPDDAKDYFKDQLKAGANPNDVLERIDLIERFAPRGNASEDKPETKRTESPKRGVTGTAPQSQAPVSQPTTKGEYEAWLKDPAKREKLELLMKNSDFDPRKLFNQRK